MATSLLTAPETSTIAPVQPVAQPAAPKTKVLHVMNGEVYGGAERALDLLALRLGEFGFEVGFACVKPKSFPNDRLAQDTPLYEMPMRGRLDLWPVAELVRVIQREGYQLLYAHTARSAMLAALASKLTGVPMVYHVQSPTSRDSTHRWKNRINALIERLSVRRASALIAVSESLGRHARAMGVAAEKVAVVPNGSPCRETVAAREVPGEWTLGITALIRPRKGIEVLLQALAILRKQGLPVRLRAVGPFETETYERQVKRLTEELGLVDAVDWVGFTRDVDAELGKMDLFVLPSLFGEGTPLVLFEAMAAGVPIVSTRVEGIPEVIRDGRDGLIVEPNDPRQLAEAIGRAVRGEVDTQAFRTSALERHTERYCDGAMARGIAQVYRRVLGQSD